MSRRRNTGLQPRSPGQPRHLLCANRERPVRGTCGSRQKPPRPRHGRDSNQGESQPMRAASALRAAFGARSLPGTTRCFPVRRSRPDRSNRADGDASGGGDERPLLERPEGAELAGQHSCRRMTSWKTLMVCTISRPVRIQYPAAARSLRRITVKTRAASFMIHMAGRVFQAGENRGEGVAEQRYGSDSRL